jgi:hypothetical protein
VVFCQFSEGAQKTYEKVMPYFFPTKPSPAEAKAAAEGDESIAEEDEEEDDPKAK